MDGTKNQLRCIQPSEKPETLAFCSLHDLKNPIVIRFLSYRYIHVTWRPSVAPRWTACWPMLSWRDAAAALRLTGSRTRTVLLCLKHELGDLLSYCLTLFPFF